MTLELADGRGELFQWDTGRRLRVGSGVEQIHYQNRALGGSVDVDVGTDGTAIIPDELLQDCHTLTAYAYVTDDTGAYTMVQVDFAVHKRAKPAGYVYTPTDQMTLQTIQRQIGDLADLTTEAKDTLVAAINEAARTGGGAGSMELRVADGYIQYSTDGGSTWTNLIAVAELKGGKGDSGADGITPTIGDNGNWFLGAEDTGKPSRGAAGAKGDTGATGPAGPAGPAGAPGKDGAGMDITGATIGQIAKITAVDTDGKPTAWGPVDMPSGGGGVTITDDDVTAERAYAAAATPKFVGENRVIPSGNTLKFVAAQDGILSVENASLISYAYVNIALATTNGQPLYSVEPIETGFAISLNPNYTFSTHFANGRFAFPVIIGPGKTYTLRWYGSKSYIYLVKTLDIDMAVGQKLVSTSTENGAHVARFEADAQYAGIRFAIDLDSGQTANITKITLAEGDTPVEYTPSAEARQVSVIAGKSYYLSGVKSKTVSGHGTFYEAPDAVLTVNDMSPTSGGIKTYATDKKFVCFGDSIWTFGASTGGIGTISDYMEQLCGGTWHNIATGGSTMANRPGSYAGDYDAFDFHALADCVASGDFSAPKAAASGLTTNIGNVDAVTWATVDVITIAYGTNDLAFGGTLDNDNNLYDKATVCGALRYGIKTIAAAYPSIKFMVLGILYRNADSVNVKTISEWNEGLRKAAEMMGAEYIPMVGINAGNHGTYLYDGTHPNAAGKEAIAKSVAKHIINI